MYTDCPEKKNWSHVIPNHLDKQAMADKWPILNMQGFFTVGYAGEYLICRNTLPNHVLGPYRIELQDFFYQNRPYIEFDLKGMIFLW